MQIVSTLQKLNFLHSLILKHATGTPENLARKLSLSTRQTYRVINELKDIGLPIIYSHKKISYIYNEDVTLKIELVVGQNTVMRSPRSE